MAKVRRLTSICRDFSMSSKDLPHISSGSKGEGLNPKGSDYDIMLIIPWHVVYESDKNVVQDWRLVLVMDTEDTPPCFTQLQLYTNINILPNYIKQQLQKPAQQRGKNLLSSELFKLHTLKILQGLNPKMKLNIHGPCFTDLDDDIDIACCLK
ncbi:Hypothetical predicted protein [Mytilus galloprovincialis]|nr:Hypothetical predicted protein [Mytilus galloprovincialis]